MARKAGDRNRDYERKRELILDAIGPRLLLPDGARLSLSEMAAAAGVSLSSLRHHVGGRAEIIATVLARYGERGEVFTRQVAAPPPLEVPLRESLRWALGQILVGLSHGVLALHALGLSAGLADPAIGPAYLRAILEPTLACMEARLGHHAARGELQPCDLRLAALALLSPLLLSALHQDGLCGREVRPLSLEQVSQEQIDRFLAAYGAPAAR